MNGASPRKHGTPAIQRIFERLEQKGCPQGLHVMAEELQWMGECSITYEILLRSVCKEMQATHPRLRRIAEGVFWFSASEIPLGWSLFGDRRMLPCFYRQYPPAISWDELDLPENILPRPFESRQQLPETRVAPVVSRRIRLATNPA
jgi:hypothetical protein